MNYLDQPVDYNIIIKLAVSILLKGILLGLALISLKDIYYRSN